MIKTVKVPVRISEVDDELRKIKYRALYKVMHEARYLGNMSIRYAIAFSLKEISKEHDEHGNMIPLDNKIYRILNKERPLHNLPKNVIWDLGVLRNSDSSRLASKQKPKTCLDG